MTFYERMTRQMLNSVYGMSITSIPAEIKIEPLPKLNPKIKQVIFNDPATIVFWSDNTKTIVKVKEGETFDKEKGLAMAIAKKALGNEGNYYETFKKYLK